MSSWFQLGLLVVAGAATAADAHGASGTSDTQRPAAQATDEAGAPAPAEDLEDLPDGQIQTTSTDGTQSTPAGVEVRTMTGTAEERVLRMEVKPPAPPPEPPAPAWEEPQSVGPKPPESGSPLLAARPPAYDLPARHKVFPQFPEQYAVMYGNKKIRCVARVWVDEHGTPERSAVMDCPAGMHMLAASAVQAWRWEKPDVTVPPGGLEVEAQIAFTRTVGGREGKPYFPGVTWLANPAEVTADPAKAALVRKGSLPSYPEQVIHGDATCEIELTVTKGGGTADMLIDGCSLPYREATFKALKSWTWYPAMADGEHVESTVNLSIVFALESDVTHPVSGRAGE
jgi:hypothetical protein